MWSAWPSSAARFRPQLAVMGTEEAAQRLREALAGEKIEIRSGMDGLIAAAEHRWRTPL